jgi:hypothetical protein
MSRFEYFQKTRVLNSNDEPLNGQIYNNDCIINFADGFISDWYNEEYQCTQPAIECSDTHIEYWENGLIKKNDNPAVVSSYGEKLGFYRNGKLINIEFGIVAEEAFAAYLNKEYIPFMHLDQINGELYSKVFWEKNDIIKRPDYIVFIDKTPYFIEVKARSFYKDDIYTMDKEKLERINALEKEYSIKVIYAITNIKDMCFKKFSIYNIKDVKFENFSFITLENFNKYVELIKTREPDIDKMEYYPFHYSLLKDRSLKDIVNINIDDDELQKSINKVNWENLKDKYSYSDILRDYLEVNNYKIIKQNK